MRIALLTLTLALALIASPVHPCPPSIQLSWVPATPTSTTEATPLTLTLSAPGISCSPSTPCLFVVDVTPTSPPSPLPLFSFNATEDAADTAAVTLTLPLYAAGTYNLSASVSTSSSTPCYTPTDKPRVLSVFPRPLPSVSFAPNVTTTATPTTAATSFTGRGSFPAQFLWFVAPITSPTSYALVGSFAGSTTSPTSADLTIDDSLLAPGPVATQFFVYTLVRNAEGGESSLIRAPSVLTVHPEPEGSPQVSACSVSVGGSFTAFTSSLAFVPPYHVTYSLIRTTDAALLQSLSASGLSSPLQGNITFGPLPDSYRAPPGTPNPTPLVLQMSVSDGSGLSSSSLLQAPCTIQLYPAPTLALSLGPGSPTNTTLHPSATPILVQAALDTTTGVWPGSLDFTINATVPTSTPPFRETRVLGPFPFSIPPTPLAVYVLDVSSELLAMGFTSAEDVSVSAQLRDHSGSVAYATLGTHLTFVPPLNVSGLSFALFPSPNLTLGVPVTFSLLQPVMGGTPPFTLVLSPSVGPSQSFPIPIPSNMGSFVLNSSTWASPPSFGGSPLTLAATVCDARNACGLLGSQTLSIVPPPQVSLAFATPAPPGSSLPFRSTFAVDVVSSLGSPPGGVSPFVVNVTLTSSNPGLCPPISRSCVFSLPAQSCTVANITSSLGSCPPLTTFNVTGVLTDGSGYVTPVASVPGDLRLVPPPRVESLAWTSGHLAVGPSTSPALDIRIQHGVPPFCVHAVVTNGTGQAWGTERVVCGTPRDLVLSSLTLPPVPHAARVGGVNVSVSVVVTLIVDAVGSTTQIGLPGSQLGLTMVPPPFGLVSGAPHPVATTGGSVALTLTNATGATGPLSIGGWTVDGLGVTGSTLDLLSLFDPGASLIPGIQVSIGIELCIPIGGCAVVPLVPDLSIVVPSRVDVVRVRPQSERSVRSLDVAWEGIRGGVGPSVDLVQYLEIGQNTTGGVLVWSRVSALSSVDVGTLNGLAGTATSGLDEPNQVGSFVVDLSAAENLVAASGLDLSAFTSGTGNVTVWRVGVALRDANTVVGPVIWSSEAIEVELDPPVVNPGVGQGLFRPPSEDEGWPLWLIILIVVLLLLCCCCLLALLFWRSSRSSSGKEETRDGESGGGGGGSGNKMEEGEAVRPVPVSPGTEDITEAGGAPLDAPGLVDSGSSTEIEVDDVGVVLAMSSEGLASGESVEEVEERALILGPGEVESIPMRLQSRSLGMVVGEPDYAEGETWTTVLDRVADELDAYVACHPGLQPGAVRVFVPAYVEDDAVLGSRLNEPNPKWGRKLDVRVAKLSHGQEVGDEGVSPVRIVAVPLGMDREDSPSVMGAQLGNAMRGPGARSVEGTHATAIEGDSVWARESHISYVLTGVESGRILDAWDADMEMIDRIMLDRLERRRAAGGVGEGAGASGDEADEVDQQRFHVARATASVPPQRVLFQIVTPTSTTLRWAPAVEGGPYSGFRVYRGLALAHEGAGVIFHDSGLEPNTMYTYVICARGYDGQWSEGSRPFRQRTRRATRTARRR